MNLPTNEEFDAFWHREDRGTIEAESQALEALHSNVHIDALANWLWECNFGEAPKDPENAEAINRIKGVMKSQNGSER